MRHPYLLIATSLLCAACVSAASDDNGTTGDGESNGAGTTHSSTGTVGDAQTSAGTSSDTTDSSPAASSSSSAGDSSGIQGTTGTSASESSDESSGGSGPLDCPAPPAALQRWQVGNDDDVSVAASGPALVLMGGGPDVDSALEAALAFTAGGDVVVVRASGGDGYNDYFFSQIGGVDSVETLLVDSAALAEDPYVACRVGAAELVWFAGGDQAEYMTFYANSSLAAAVQAVHEGGGVVGGTSAGLAILGAHVFAAYEGTVYPEEVLEDPYNQYMELDAGPFSFAGLERVITDSHFYERDRMGRLIGFLARLVQDATATDPVGIGVDEATALLIDAEGVGTVYGDGFVYVLEAAGAPQVCQPGVALSYQGLQLWRLQSGDTVSLEPVVSASVPVDVVGAESGALVPANPY